MERRDESAESAECEECQMRGLCIVVEAGLLASRLRRILGWINIGSGRRRGLWPGHFGVKRSDEVRTSSASAAKHN